MTFGASLIVAAALPVASSGTPAAPHAKTPEPLRKLRRLIRAGAFKRGPGDGYLYGVSYGNGSVPPTIFRVDRDGRVQALDQCVPETGSAPAGNLVGTGVPSGVHTVKAADDLTEPYVTIGTATANASGKIVFDDARTR
jgi:hypothetical protein